MSPEQTARWHDDLVKADQHWARSHRANPLPPDRLAWLLRAILGAQRERELEHANTRALVARLVDAVLGGWDPRGDPAAQAREALQVIRKVEAHLRKEEQEVA